MKIFKALTFLFFCFFLFNLKVSALEDGVYVIHSAINRDYVIDVYNGEAKNGSNIQLYKSNRSNAQKFKVKKIDETYYEITSYINPKYVLDVYNASFQNLSNVQLFNTNNSKAQKWILDKTDDGYYTIFSYDGVHCLDVNSGIAENYRNIQLFKSNKSAAQKFEFERMFEPEQSVSNGVYTISSSLDFDKMVEVSSANISNFSNIQLYSNNKTDAQKWFINYLGDGYYTIKPYLSIDFSMEAAGGGVIKGTNVQLYKYNGTNAQKWIIHDAGDGYYNIICACNNLALDVYNGDTKNGTNIWMYTYNGSAAQKFKINKVIEQGSKSINDGYYFINTSLGINKVLDVYSGYMMPETNVQIYDINSSLAQKWYVKYQNDGYYSILSDKDNNYVLEIDPNGNNVRIGKNTNSDNQKWIIKKTGSYYYLISKDGRYLDLASASTVNGNNIRVFAPNGTNAQKFGFRKTASGLSEQLIDNGFYRIVSALDNDMVIDLASASTKNGNNIQLYKTNGSKAQKWEITYLDNGYYKISSMLDLTKSFDVYNCGSTNGSNVQIYDNNNSLAQQWIIKDAGDGYFYIISNCSGLFLEAAGGGKTNGTNIQMYEDNGTKAQKFKLLKTNEENKVLDVSYHQGEIDWDKVANSGIYGVILRIGYWDTEDERFGEYIKEVKRLGIPYGIYLFSYASTTNGANTEANFTNNIISKYDLNPTLGIYYDLEDWYISSDNTSNNLSKTNYDDIARTYINSVTSHVGNKYKVKIYANLNFVNNRFGDYARSQTDWVAHYGVPECGYDGPHSLWQYTSEATLDGIRGYVDMNYLY